MARKMSDDGWKSRKLWAMVAAMALIMGGFWMCKDRNAAFTTFVGGILTSAGLFKAANLVEKLKGQQSSPPKSPPTA